MRKIREVLRLRLGQRLSQRAIGRSLQLSVGAVNTYLSRARMAGLGWPLPTDLDDEQLKRLLYPPPSDVATERRPSPDWAMVHRELLRPRRPAYDDRLVACGHPRPRLRGRRRSAVAEAQVQRKRPGRLASGLCRATTRSVGVACLGYTHRHELNPGR